MKKLKIIFLPLWLTLFSLTAKAQTGFKYINLSGGYLFKPSNGLTGTISLEIASKYHNSFELFGEFYRGKLNEDLSLQDTLRQPQNNINRITVRRNYLFGAVYKPLIVRSKNTSFRFKVGAGLGSNGIGFIIAPQAGFEISQAISKGYELMVQQNNNYTFLDAQHWRSGLAVGVKLPIE